MKNTVRLLMIVMALSMLVFCGGVDALATADTAPDEYEEFINTVYDMMEDPVDYDGLFELSDGVDGAFSEGYYYEMNRLFDENPEAFITALFDQSYERISRFGFAVAFEHQQDLDGYRACLDSAQQSIAKEDAFFVMRMGILVVESNTKFSNPEYYEQAYQEQVKQLFNENKQLFLLGMPVVGDSFYSNVASALIADFDNTQLQKLRNSLTEEDVETEGAAHFIVVVHQQIDSVLKSELPDDLEEPEPSERPDTPSDETKPSAPKQTVTDPDTTEQKEKTSSGYVWIVVTAVAVVIGAAVVIGIKRRKV